VLEGTVIGRCMQRHRHEEFIRFLNAAERAVPAGRIIEAVVDNYATHKHPKVKAWLARHPRWTFHFTPTSASWLNAVETFFSALTRQRIRRGSFRSIEELVYHYLDVEWGGWEINEGSFGTVTFGLNTRQILVDISVRNTEDHHGEY
jgi:transposase